MRIQNFAVLIVSLLGGFPQAEAYYGRRSTEAVLTFEAQIDAVWGGNSVAALNSSAEARELIDVQIQHLMGTFQSESFQEEFGYPGVLGEDHKIKFTGIERGSSPERKLLRYKYEGKVVFQKDAFRSTKIKAVPLKLPLAPDLVYELGVVRGLNKCTDRHYNSEDDFWYFWDPEMKGCPLSGDEENVLRIEGKLTLLPNTKLTYPEYDKLYGDNGNGEKFEIALFMGYSDDITSLKKHSRRDEAVGAFKQIEKALRGMGFEVSESKDAFRLYRDGRSTQGINYLRRFERDNVVVTALLADTGIESRDVTFQTFLKDGFADADIVIYDGHSGLGGNLNIDEMPQIKIKPGKYQIYFFNGCSSYPYYNQKFFRAKGGSRNLEVITSGLPTYFDTAGPNLLAFIDGFLEGKKMSYQRIMQNLERSNGDHGTYLIGVNGDEDNRWKP